MRPTRLRLLASLGGAILIVLLILLLHPRPARAEHAVCPPLAELIAHLADRFGEAPVLLGVGGRARVIVTGNPGGESWTIVMRRPDGTGCVVASGKAWTLVEPPAPGERL